MGWSPPTFWESTPAEFFSALEERARAMGGDPDKEREAEFLKFKERVENGDRRRSAVAD